MRTSTWNFTLTALAEGQTETEVSLVAKLSAERPVDALLTLTLPKGAQLLEGRAERRLGAVLSAEVLYRDRKSVV